MVIYGSHPDGSEIRHKQGCVERTRVHYAERQGEVFVQKLEEAHGYAQEPRRSYELCRQFVHGCFFRGAVALFDNFVELAADSEYIIVQVKIHFVYRAVPLVLSKSHKRNTEMIARVYPLVHNKPVEVRIL